MNGLCQYHNITSKPANHTTARCSWTLRLQRGDGLPPPPPGPPPPQGVINIGSSNQRNERPRQPPAAAGRSRDAYPNKKDAYVIFIIKRNDKRSHRLRIAEVNVVVPAVQQLMHWASQPITFGPADHPDVMPTPGGYSLLLDPTIVTDKEFATSLS